MTGRAEPRLDDVLHAVIPMRSELRLLLAADLEPPPLLLSSASMLVRQLLTLAAEAPSPHVLAPSRRDGTGRMRLGKSATFRSLGIHQQTNLQPVASAKAES